MRHLLLCCLLLSGCGAAPWSPASVSLLEGAYMSKGNNPAKLGCYSQQVQSRVTESEFMAATGALSAGITPDAKTLNAMNEAAAPCR